MSATNSNNPLRTTDHEANAAPPAPEDIVDHARGSASTNGSDPGADAPANDLHLQPAHRFRFGVGIDVVKGRFLQPMRSR